MKYKKLEKLFQDLVHGTLIKKETYSLILFGLTWAKYYNTIVDSGLKTEYESYVKDNFNESYPYIYTVRFRQELINHLNQL